MSRPLVERLRFLANGQDDLHSVALAEAADEIERQNADGYALLKRISALEAEVERLTKALNWA